MEQRISQAGRTFIIRRESLRLIPYKDNNGHWTCGYGHLMGREPIGDERWTTDAAMDLLIGDLAIAEKAVNALGAQMSQPQFDALCSLVFNIGSGHFAGSTTAKCIRMAEWQLAANAILLWRDHGHGEERRKAEREIFLYGTP